MNKRGGWRYLIVLGVVLFLAVGVIAEENGIDISKSIGKSLSNETQEYIKDFVAEENINSIEQVDLQNPPEEVKLGKEIDDTNVAIYEVNYTKQNESKKLFVVTYSSEKFKVPLELKPANAVEYLSFGETLETSGSVYLKTNTGVRSSAEKGYVMMDEGSITGISTNIEAVSGEGRINMIVYVNGEDVGLRNLVYVDSAGIKKDYDKQSQDVIKFQPGDVISVYVETQGGVAWKDAINLVKIELD
ncbi:MAG: hypothetical protein WC584_04525 [Candidatus Pacearchaeota archaeon]